MTDDTTHNLTIVRDALEAEGLEVHVGLIDAAIQEIAGLRTHLYGLITIANQQLDRALVAERQLASARKALEVMAEYLQDNSSRLSAILNKDNWTPRRSHIESDRNVMVAAENTLRQALISLTDDKGKS